MLLLTQDFELEDYAITSRGVIDNEFGCVVEGVIELSGIDEEAVIDGLCRWVPIFLLLSSAEGMLVLSSLVCSIFEAEFLDDFDSLLFFP